MTERSVNDRIGANHEPSTTDRTFMARVTLKQLAEELNLSTTTVSDVVRGKGTSRVSDQTRGRILAAAGQLGYRSNRLSRALRTQRSQIIGMLSSGLPAVSTSRERFAALERLLAAQDYVVSFALHHSEEVALGRALDAFQDLCVGAIVTEWMDTPLERLLATRLVGPAQQRMRCRSRARACAFPEL